MRYYHHTSAPIWRINVSPPPGWSHTDHQPLRVDRAEVDTLWGRWLLYIASGLSRLPRSLLALVGLKYFVVDSAQ